MSSDENNKSTRRKPLSKAEKRCRQNRKLARKYPNADFAQVGSDPEPAIPAQVPAEAFAYLIDELRRACRSSKQVYGAHLTDKLQRVFGPIDPSNETRMVNWINWLGRNRQELIFGKYAPGYVPVDRTGAQFDPTVSSGTLNDTPSTINRADKLPLHPHAPTPEANRTHRSSLVAGHQETSASTGSSDVAVAPSPPVNQASNPVELEPGTAVGDKDVQHGAPASSKPLADKAGPPRLPPAQNDMSEGVTSSSPQMPAKAPFFGQKEGAFKANRLFGKIYHRKPLSEIIELAATLAADEEAFNEVLNRGPTERAYLLQAMHDLGVPLP